MYGDRAQGQQTGEVAIGRWVKLLLVHRTDADHDAVCTGRCTDGDAHGDAVKQLIGGRGVCRVAAQRRQVALRPGAVVVVDDAHGGAQIILILYDGPGQVHKDGLIGGLHILWRDLDH